MQAYPVVLERDENGTVIASFADVPEAVTVGRDEAEALERAPDALATALLGYVDRGRPFPVPGASGLRPAIGLPPMVEIKLAIHRGLRESGLGQTGLAERLGCDPRQVRRLLDLDHHSRLDQLEAALAALGKRLEVEICEVA